MPLPAIIVKWAGREFPIEDLEDSTTLADLKKILEEKTDVRRERQKIFGLKCKGKPAVDSDHMRDMGLKEKQKIMMVGSSEETIMKAMELPDVKPEVVNDFDIEEVIIAVPQRQEFLDKIQRRVSTIKINQFTEPRENKKLLVLDIDYTLFDHRSSAESAAELKRPFLHEFLTAAYEDYDIVIWSATSMKWIDVKMKELGVTGHPAYKILFHLDSASMISVWVPERGVLDCKPLGVIWGKYPQYSAKNTIMFDDVSRNFIMNPQNGLKIRPFREAHFNRDTDRELIKLGRYLKLIASLDDLSELNHKKWERYLEKNGSK
ncbi:ubiquitin-like domain-containing CTD phosphatase 1 [Galendromus occidentalis]|uniref:Ubiquitin-like domain-containing CTD phosphatase 1 n=1 Tax=Galendromus occidentalis TaxID=34638 RepID=A0AAJ6VZE0_9ACAR|nr:ubiquitin-like domain-containing CTD phosphatase 1 [Galendromus occidentalis]